jgi:hypothetical protein
VRDFEDVMRKSATDIMQEILFAASVDAVVAFKAAAKGVPNALLRDLNAVHPNTALADLPAEVQQVIANGVRTAFARLLKEGYTVAPGTSAPPPPRSDPPRPRPAPRGPGRPPVVEVKRPMRRPPPKR